MEILSPAGSKEALESAVRAGANAVYFGTTSFNARRNAKNFSDEELKNITRYCHIRNVKAYLTLNTLISDNEIDKALKLVELACEAQIDGIIINDIGLASLVKQFAPDMPLHASTQMTIHNIEGVKLLKQMGYTRVVLARENSLKEIIEIAEFANKEKIELEIFVQGAHCMCISGQCLLSSVLGSRSGNRGLCAQPCRLPFSVENGNGFDLSLKDMNLYKYFKDFQKINIASLKIEGRMKSPEYVAMATQTAVLAKNNQNDITENIENLGKVFSRNGFTDGYLQGNIDKNMFGTRSEQDIENTKVIKNSIHNIYRKENNSVALDFNITFKNNKKSIFEVSDNINKITLFGESAQKAKNQVTDEASIIEKIKKLGSTPYFANKIKIDIDNDLFVPNSVISELKNKAIELISEKRSTIKPIKFKKSDINISDNRIILKQKKYISVHNLSQIPEDKNIADLIFIPFSSEIEKVKNLIKSGYKIAIKTPSVNFSLNLKERLSLFKSIGIEYALVENLGAFLPVTEANIKPIAGTRINIFNSFSANVLPFEQIMMSVELDEAKIHNFKSSVPKGMLVYGKLPLMMFRNCPIKSYTGCSNCNHKINDRKGLSFNIYCEDGISQMYNNRPVFLGDKPGLYKDFDFIMFSFTDESSDKITEVLNTYKNQSECKEEFTRGLYFKGVL